MDSSDDSSDTALEIKPPIAPTKRRGTRSKIWINPIAQYFKEVSPRPTGSKLKSIDIEKPSTSRELYDDVKTLKRKSISTYELDKYSKMKRFSSNPASHCEDPASTGSKEKSMVKLPKLSGNDKKIIRPSSLSHDETYAASGSKRTLHGVIYQLKHLMLVLNRARELGYPFRLLTGMDAVEKFDDLVLQYQDNTGNEMHRLVQIKHKLDNTELIKSNDLLADKDGAFSVKKYFNSWRKIKQNSAFEKSILKDFILCTNIGLDIQGLNQANIGVDEVKEPDEFLKVKDRKKQPPRYKFRAGKHTELYGVLKTASDIHQLAQVLARCVRYSQKIDVRTNIVERYHIALAQEVIDIGKKRFSNDFIKNNLSATAKRFRDLFLSQLLSKKHVHRKDILKYLEKCELNLSQAFGQNTKSANESELNQVTELPNDYIYDEEIFDFFDKFVLAVDQPNEVELNNNIKLKMGDNSMFNFLYANLVGDSFQNDILNWFKDRSACFLEKKKAKAFFKEFEVKLCSIMTMRLSWDYLKMLEKYDIAFERQNVDLLNFLQSAGPTQKPILQFVSSAPSLVTALRVYQTLQQAEKYNKTDSLIFTHLEKLLQPKTMDILSHAFKNPHNYNLLVIDCGSISAKPESQRLWNLLGDIMTKNSEKRMILIIQGNSDSSVQFEIGSEISHEKKDDISIGNLNESSRRQLLQKKVVKFQGQEERTSFGRLLGIPHYEDVEKERLTELSRIIKVDTLVKLIQDEEIRIGSEVKGLDEIEDYYIPRKIVRHGDIKRDILNEDEFAERNEQGKIVVLSDEAGMGKRTILTHLAIKIKQKESCTLVIRIDLTQNTGVLVEERQKRSFGSDDTNKAVDFLVDKLASIQTDLESQVFKTIVKDQGNAVLLFDGFDEITPTYTDIVIDLLQALAKLPIKKLFLTTRSYAYKKLEEQENKGRFCLALYKLQPFSVENQTEFLIKFWKRICIQNNLDEGTEECLRNHARDVIHLLSRSINDYMNIFTGIPLKTRLVAENFQYPSELPERLDIIDLYTGFIEKKYRIFLNEKQVADETIPAVARNDDLSRKIFWLTHQKIALDALFCEKDVKTLLLSQPEIEYCLKMAQEIIKDEEHTGIITQVIEGKPYFVDRTFAEYFAAEFLFNTMKDDIRNQDIREILLKKVFIDEEYRTVRSFLDRLLHDVSNAAKEEPRQEILRGDRDLDETTVYHITAREGNIAIMRFLVNCLRPTLRDISDSTGKTPLHDAAQENQNLGMVKYLLEEGADINTLDKDNRTALHDAALAGDNLEVVKYLVENGADINSLDKDSRTALHDAARTRANLDVVKYLVKNGADINSLDKDGRTTLHDAALADENLDVVTYLMEHGADINSLDKDGRTPLYYAVSRGEDLGVVKYLSKIGAVIHSSGSKRQQHTLDDEWNERITKLSDEGNGQPHESRPYLAVNDNQRASNNYNENERGSNQNPLQRLIEEMTYWRISASSFRGAVHQLKHLGFTLLHAMKNKKGINFLLPKEGFDIGKFDDFVLEYLNNKRENVALFLYFKYSRVEGTMVKATDLLNLKNKFSIPAYFIYWRNIQKIRHFDSVSNKYLILSTNINLDLKDLKKAGISCKPIDRSDERLEMIRTNEETICYEFDAKLQFNRKLYDELKQMSDVHILARTLAEHVCESKKLEVKGIFKQYHVALGKQVIDIERQEFFSNFIHNINIHPEAIAFRQIFSEECSKLYGSSSKKWTFDNITLELSTSFGKPLDEEKQANSQAELPHDVITNDDIATFLKVFNLAVNLPDEVEPAAEKATDEIARDSKFKLLNADLIGLTSLRKIVGWIRENGEEVGEGTYLSYAGGEDFIKEIENRIPRFMFMGSNSVYCEELKKYGIQFERGIQSKYLREFLSDTENKPNSTSHNILILKALKSTLLSTLRIFQALVPMQYPTGTQNERERLKEDSFIFIRLQTLLREGIKDEILGLFQSEEYHNLLFIECDLGSMEPNPRELWLSLGRVITNVKNANKKIILITQEDMILQYSLDEQFEGAGTHSENDDKISFIDFTPDSRRNLLEKETVIFQGHEKRISFGRLLGINDTRSIKNTELKYLYKLLDSRNLVDLIRSDDKSTVTIGNDLEGLDEVKDYYISRSIIRSVFIDEDIFRDNKRANRLVFSGIDRDDLPKNLENFDIFDSDEKAEEFIKLSQESKNYDNLHWLKAESGKYIWKKSVGDISYLAQYRDTIDSGNYDGTTCALHTKYEFATHDGPVILSDTAGSGKSTMMTYLAGEMKKNAPDLLVLKIDLFRISKELEHVGQKSNSDLRNPEQAVKFLVDKLLIRTENNYSKMIFKWIIIEQRRVAIIFDGFNEISPPYESTVINLLHGLAKHGVKKLFVVTRPHTREVLEKEFNTFSYQLQPFFRDDQKEFLIKFWNNRLGSANLDRKIEQRIMKYAEAIMKKLQDSINDSIYNFTGIPLRTKLVAEVFQNTSKERRSEFDTCDTFKDSNEDQPKLPYKLTLIDLYEYFMDKKYHIFFNKFHADKADLQVQSMCNLIKDIFMARHMKLAVDTLFNQELAKKLLPSDSYVSLKCDIAEETGYNFDEPGGIVPEFVNEKPHFGHRTYAEYFVAKYLTDTLKEGNLDESVSKVFVEEILLNKNYVNLRAFMNGLLSEEHHLLHESWKAHIQKLRNNRNQTIFHVIAAEGHAELTNLFLNCLSGAPKAQKTLIDREDASSYRAVCLATKYGHLEELKVLVEIGQGAVNYITDRIGKTPLHIAVESGKLDVVKYLVEQGAKVNFPDAGGNTPLHKAVRRGQKEVVKYLVEQEATLDYKNKNGQTPLFVAADSEQLEVLKYFTKQGANVDSSDDAGNTPLHNAVRWGRREVVKYLVEKGANVNPSDTKGMTPLHIAVLIGEIQVVKYLFEQGANVDSPDDEGNTPLHNAVRKGRKEVVKCLVEQGATLDYENRNGQTPLSVAADSGQLEVLTYFNEQGAIVDPFDAKRNTPLHHAGDGGRREVVIYLVEQGANVNSPDAEGNTPLHKAARGGEMEVVKYLVEQGANVNSFDAKGNTPLHKAARGGEMGVVKYLVEQGARLDSRNKNCQTPLDEAISADKSDILGYLRAYKA